MDSSRSLWDYLPFLLQGIPVTLEVTFLAIALSIPVSLILALGRMNAFWVVRWSAGLVIEGFRGSSALVQLFWAYYVLPFFGINLPPFWAGVIVLGLNEGSYFAEVVRPALLSVVAGQREAAIALHLPRLYRFFRIVLPQALPVLIPPFGNSLIGMLKFTSLVSLVTIQDLSFRASLIRTTIGESGPIYAVTLLIYFVLAMGLVAGVRLVERAANRWVGKPTPDSKFWSLRQATSVPSWALLAR